MENLGLPPIATSRLSQPPNVQMRVRNTYLALDHDFGGRTGHLLLPTLPHKIPNSTSTSIYSNIALPASHVYERLSISILCVMVIFTNISTRLIVNIRPWPVCTIVSTSRGIFEVH